MSLNQFRVDPVVWVVIAIVLWFTIYAILGATIEPTIPPYDTCCQKEAAMKFEELRELREKMKYLNRKDK